MQFCLTDDIFIIILQLKNQLDEFCPFFISQKVFQYYTQED